MTAPLTEEQLREIRARAALECKSIAHAREDIPTLLAELDRIRDLLRPAVKYPCEIKAAKGCADAIGMERIDQWCLPCFARYVRGEQAEGDGDE